MSKFITHFWVGFIDQNMTKVSEASGSAQQIFARYINEKVRPIRALAIFFNIFLTIFMSEPIKKQCFPTGLNVRYVKNLTKTRRAIERTEMRNLRQQVIKIIKISLRRLKLSKERSECGLSLAR
jgi:hypothetical protein